MITNQVIVVAILAVVAAVVLGGLALVTLLNPQRTARDRIQELTQAKKKDDAASVLDYRAVRTVTAQVSKLASPDATSDAGNLLKRRLLQAGFRGRGSVEAFSAVRAGLALALPIMTLLILPEMNKSQLLMIGLIMASIGYYAPGFIVTSRIEGRQKAIMKSFPDALDLLVSSVEAGLGLDAAFRRVADEIEGPAPILAAELKAVNQEVTAGVSRVEALRHLDQRTGLEDMKQLVNVLAQAERFGTSVARALRVHADLVRTKRQLKAEEKAAQISPKLTVVMILFIMPSLFAILLGPAMVQVFRQYVQQPK
jgi:tight adherence protein C